MARKQAIQWLYRREKGDPGWQVGFEDSNAVWHTESLHETMTGASGRCTYLNQTAKDPGRSALVALAKRVRELLGSWCQTGQMPSFNEFGALHIEACSAIEIAGEKEKEEEPNDKA